MSSDDQDFYRKVYPRMFSDARIMALTRPPPNGLTVWFHLLFGEHTGVTPGLFRVGERAFAETLGWPLHAGESLLESFPKGLPKGFREAFAEVVAEGLAKADWNARLVYVKNAIRVHVPANPNVILKWAKHWRSLPECELKDEAERDFRSIFESISESFVEAFDKVSGKKPWNQRAVSSEQKAVNSRGGKKRAMPRADPPPPPVKTMLEARATLVPIEQAVELFEHYQTEHARVHRSAKVLVAPSAGLEAAKAVLTLAGGDMESAKAVVTRYVESDHGYWRERNHALWLLANGKDFEQARLSTGPKAGSDASELPF